MIIFMLILIAKLIGIKFIVLGCIVILRPEKLRAFIDYCKEGNNFYILSALRILIGMILIVVSFQSRIPWIVFVVGLLFFIIGIAMILQKKVICIINDEVFDTTKTVKNLIGTIPILIGVILLSAL
ncbi:conserved hypothetical protein, membrane [Candidatus Omnitrophus magneticus]|uniref:Uncharacterized protein n=1 Tax=Candidatus Omnitrophus magneticus TaxID=1609969 RepID=A0A0F0CPD9_9BACT|nr:conserved hypothetical protein, membrane [Candidatus Omnitrophus magneticus]